MPHKLVDLYNHVAGVKGFDYDQINEGVFIGTNMCCQFGFNKELLAKGVRADISLEEDKVDAPTGVDYYMWLPTVDGQPPVQDKLLLGAKTLDFLISRKIKVYIHCKNGHGRAPTLFAAYLIKKGVSFDDAMQQLKAKRPTFHLTDAQKAGLEAFAQSLPQSQ